MPAEEEEDPELFEDENEETEEALDLNENVDLRGCFTLVSCLLSARAGLCLCAAWACLKGWHWVSRWRMRLSLLLVS